MAAVFEGDAYFGVKLPIGGERTCDCPKNHLNCLTAKEWLKCQLGVWQFAYECRDIRNKKIHPATFPISLARRVIELFTHKGEIVLDPFVGSGTTLVAAMDCERSAAGFDLKKEYIELCSTRLEECESADGETAVRENADRARDSADARESEDGSQRDTDNSPRIFAVHDEARNIAKYFDEESVKLIFTSPPYANLLNRPRKNKSRRNRKNEQLGKVEQYSQDARDLGTMEIAEYTRAMGDIFESLLPILKPKAHCVINVPDMWWENERITIHVSLIEELRKRGYELRNTIIWDRKNIVNRIGIFGWPSNFITMGTTFEYLLDFAKPE
ncbi:site-specific DNA-methyltransferase [bacterium]|nr:site-specific DNA-methyltransferase [bacterium]